MDAQQFLAEFGYIANAPGGVAQLRQMIYHLAVTGSLTPRTDGPDAGALLREVERTRRRLIREKKYKRITALESEPVRPPYDIVLPETWRWTRLLDIGEINPRNAAPDDQLAAFVTMSGVPQRHHEAVVAEKRRWGDIKKGFTHFANGDAVLAKITPCFENGKAAVIANLPVESGIGAGTTELQVFRPIHAGILPEYVYLFIRSPLFVVEGEKSMTGTAGQKRLSTSYFATRAFPLPPADEQAGIVTKVDELMVLCDKLEVQKQAGRGLQDSFRQSCLEAVATATSNELQAAWIRLDGNFGRLFSAPEDVVALRSMCVELAIRGELTTPGDTAHGETVATLLAFLQENKGGRRVAKLDEFDEPFPLPRNWAWVQFEDLLAGSDAGWSPKCESEPRKPGEWGVLKVSAVTWGEFRPGENKRLPPSLEPRTECEARPGDFLLSRANTAELVARSVVVPESCPERLLLSDKIVRLNFVDPSLKAWANLVNNSGYARDYYRANATGTSDSMRNVSRQVIHELPLPLPPREVQHSILQKVKQLHAWCDELESRLRDARELAARFAAASIATFTGVDAAQHEDGPVKPPNTQLIAPLRLGQVPDVRSQAPLATILARHDGQMSASELWQRFGGKIDDFYAQLKTEVGSRWILEPEPAEMREIPVAAEVA